MKFAVINSPLLTSFLNKAAPKGMELYSSMVPDDFWELRELLSYSEEHSLLNNEDYKADINKLTDPSDMKFGLVRGTREDFKDPNNIARIFAMAQQIEYSGGPLEGEGLWITEPTVQQVVTDAEPWNELHHVMTLCCNHFWQYSNASWYSATYLKDLTDSVKGIEIFIILDDEPQ